MGHRADRDVEWRASWGLAVVGQLTVVEVSLEDDQVGFREVEEEIGSFGVEVPVGEPGTPEGMLFVDLESDPYVSTKSAFGFNEGDLPRSPAFRTPRYREILSAPVSRERA